MIVLVPIHFIRTEGLQLRKGGTDPKIVEEYRAVLDELSPVLLFREAPDLYWLADGHHTLSANAAEGRTEIRATVREDREELDRYIKEFLPPAWYLRR
jgi:hypothetical protein